MDSDLVIELVDEHDDPAEMERLALALRSELLEIEEVESVTAASAGPAPDGTRAFDVAALGALVVAVEPTVALLGKVLEVVQRWLSLGSPSRHMVVTINGQSIELRATAEQQRELYDRFLASVAVDAPPPTDD